MLLMFLTKTYKWNLGISALLLVLVAFATAACAQAQSSQPMPPDEPVNKQEMANMETATFGNGCFWCTEAVFQNIKGVKTVVSGYTGGKIANPTYREVSSGRTGHAEAVQIVYDPAVVTYDELLEVFWKTHDPTTLNRQGADVGTQYRSAVFFHDEAQRKAAAFYKEKLDKAGIFSGPIVTEITEFDGKFYIAEDYHQNYFALNGRAPYCQYVIVPKLKKMREIFADKLKDNAATSN